LIADPNSVPKLQSGVHYPSHFNLADHIQFVSDPGDNSTWLERLNRNARNRGVPEGQIRGIMGPDVVLESGELKGGLSRMLDGNHAHGSIRANEVAIAGINYAGITAREAVLLVLGAKAAEYGLQAGNFLLMRTRAGAWVIKQGERAIVLTTEQVGKLRQAIRNATKAGDKLTDAQVDDLLLAPKGLGIPLSGKTRSLAPSDLGLADDAVKTLTGSIGRVRDRVIIRIEKIEIAAGARGANSISSWLDELVAGARASGAKQVTIEGVSVGNSRLADILMKRFGFQYTPQRTLVLNLP
jgi:hypothetical protein